MAPLEPYCTVCSAPSAPHQAVLQDSTIARQGDPSSVTSAVLAAEAHQQKLREFLTCSSEMPEATRKWPAWRLRLVPKIVAALASDAPPQGSMAEVGGGGVPLGAGSSQRGREHRAASRRGRAAVEGGGAVEEGEGGDLVKGPQVEGSGQRGRRGSKENMPANAGAGARAGVGRAAGDGRKGPSSAARAASKAAVAPARCSSRQRRANCKFDQFLVEAAQ